MADFNDLLGAIKKAGTDAVEAGDPVAVEFGKVLSASPLRIQIDQKLILEASQLKLTRSVANHSVRVNAIDAFTDVDAVTGTAEVDGKSGTASIPKHSGTAHVPQNTGTSLCALATGDVVVLLRMQGGKQYVVIDKVV